jgi:CRISPR/Cas system CSM-associated protein Csm4 (group 5 of RAMP superfamily)
MENFNPAVLINDHFDKIKDQVETKLEFLIKSTSLEEANTLKEIKQTQIEKIKEIKAKNLSNLEMNETEFKSKWKNFTDEATLNASLKIEEIKEELIVNDCILVEEEEGFAKSLWITPWFFNSKNLEFLQ